ncbi:hypothetical protein FJ251_13575 [bacterium]|nr:hypothetical protein [bacterium]
MPEQRRPGGRCAALALLLGLLVARPAAGQTWSIAGDALRQLHAETLEEVLRACPLLVVERQGGAGLPYRVQAGAARPGELLLVVDGEPWRDPWSGALLAEELPLSLVEAVAVDLGPQLVAHGGEAIAGAIRVQTRRPSLPRVTTRIHLSRGRFRERGRHLAFATPPGDLALSVGLDEVFSDGYPFSAVWNGEPAAASADPEVGTNRRRALSARLRLAAAGAGPLELALDESEWHFDRRGSRSDAWYRDLLRLGLALPASPLGAWQLEQRFLERRSGEGRANDAAVALRWSLAADSLGSGFRLAGGAERHQLGFSSAAGRSALPRPARGWLTLQWRGGFAAGPELQGGLRLEAERERRGRLGAEARLAWAPAVLRGTRLRAALATGSENAAWERDRLVGLGLWPAGLGRPGAAAAADPLLRGLLALQREGETAWGQLCLSGETGGRDWQALAAGEGFAWRSLAGERRGALDLVLGARLRGLGGELRAAGSLRAEARERAAPLGEGSFYPLVLRGELALGRPFFARDARLDLSGGLELRGGRADHRELLRADVGVDLRVLAARFWLRVVNALDRPGEELPGFPSPPVSLRLGLDWHLDQ